MIVPYSNFFPFALLSFLDFWALQGGLFRNPRGKIAEPSSEHRSGCHCVRRLPLHISFLAENSAPLSEKLIGIFLNSVEQGIRHFACLQVRSSPHPDMNQNLDVICGQPIFRSSILGEFYRVGMRQEICRATVLASILGGVIRNYLYVRWKSSELRCSNAFLKMARLSRSPQTARKNTVPGNEQVQKMKQLTLLL